MNNKYINQAKALGLELGCCKECGGPIVWDNSKIRISRDGVIKYEGRTHEATRLVNNHEYKLKVCQDCFERKYGSLRGFNVMHEPIKWAFDISEEDYQAARNKYALTEQSMISKYGEVLGRQKWDEYCEKQRVTNTFEYKKSKYGWSEEDFKNYNKSRAVTLKNLIKRHGEELGRQKWDEYCEKQRVTKSWEYLVEKYGEEKARQINKSKAITLENMIKVHGVDEGKVRYAKWVKQFTTREPTRWSKTSQRIFDQMKEIFDQHGLSCQYQTYGGEFSCITSAGGYLLDFYCPELKIAIEYNGGVFHADPRLYSDDERCDPLRPAMTAKEIRERDKIRNESIENELDIKVYVIWELDYKEGLDVENFTNSILKKHNVF